MILVAFESTNRIQPIHFYPYTMFPLFTTLTNHMVHLYGEFLVCVFVITMLKYLGNCHISF